MSDFINRATTQANRGKQLYYVSAIEATNLTTKEQFSQAISQANITDLSLIPLSSKLGQKLQSTFLTERIFNVGIYEQSTADKSFKGENVKEAHFLFYDLEHKEGASTKQLSFTDTIKILEDNELNYILTTSFSHSEEDPRFHLFIPLYRVIRTPEEYKYNWNLFRKKYLNEYSLDESTKNINRWIYPAKKETLQVVTEFSKNDYIASPLSEAEIAITVKLESANISYERNPKALALFNKQVSGLHKFIPERFDSNGVIKFKRDSNDKTANVFVSSQENNSSYSKYTLWDKKESFNTLFSYNDYALAIDAHSKREPLQEIIRATVSDWFSDYSPKYLITNEGLGKSTAILKLGHSEKFIFAVHTRVRAEEVGETLLKEGIPFVRILNNEEVILQASGDLLLAEAYKKYQNNKSDEFITLKGFLNQQKIPEEDQVNIKEFYNQNISNILDTTKVRIVTTRKLQIEIQRAIRAGVNHFSDHFIIFDEFILTEWTSVKAPTIKEIEKGTFTEHKSIWSTGKKIKFSENKDSFLNLLKQSKKVLILTTERDIVEPILSNSNFKELKPSYNFIYQHQLIQFEAKLSAPNVHYLLVNSTRGDKRADLLKAVIKTKFVPDFIISNKVQQGGFSGNFLILEDGSRIDIKTPASVKGKNLLESASTIVLGTLADESHVNLVYYSSELYFISKNLTEKELREDIQNRILVTSINQSIGRNQGFRSKGAKTLVILPLLQNGKTKKNFKALESLRYISHSVVAIRTAEIIKRAKRVEEAEEQECFQEKKAS
ncbi:MAG: hypothetical protein Q7T77_07075 [Sulfuricurvum sp.]|nr:hypothetical protein [Sulfuricurvum sp.]